LEAIPFGELVEFMVAASQQRKSRPAALRIGLLVLIVLGFLAAFIPSPVQAVPPPTGGPDGSVYKYRWKDSLAAGCPAAPGTTTGPCPVNPTTGWTEIAPLSGGTGTTVPFTSATASPEIVQYSSSCVSIGFTFVYYGASDTCVWVHANSGHIFPVTSSAVPPAPAAGVSRPTTGPLPSTADENGIIAGWWAHLSPYFCNGDYYSAAEASPTVHIYYKTIGTAPTQTFIVEYSKVTMWHHSSAGGASTCVTPSTSCVNTGNPCVWSTFQIRLYEGSNNIDVILKSVAEYTSTPPATDQSAIGIEDPTGANGLGYHYDTAGGITYTNLAVRFYPNHGPGCGMQNVLLNEDAASASFTMTATDADGDAMAGFNLLTAPNHGPLWTPPVGTISPVTGTYPAAAETSFAGVATRTYVPAANWNSDPGISVPEVITYQTKDSLGTVSVPTSPATACGVNFNVNPVNDAPLFTKSGPGTSSGAAGSLISLSGWATGVAPGVAGARDEAGLVGGTYPSAQPINWILQPHIWSNSVFGTLPALVRDAPAATSTTATLSYVGATAGTYTACFRAQDSGGTTFGGVDLSSNTECIDITITSGGGGGGGGGGGTCTNPTANFQTNDNLVYGQPVLFSDLSTGTVSDWQWNFGDGLTGTGQGASHTYMTSGTYTVRLVVRNSCGVSSFMDKTIYISAPGPGSSGGQVGGGLGTPVVNAGEDKIVKERARVVLAGSSPTSGATFSWRQASGPQVTLRNATSASPDFTAPQLLDPSKPEYLIFGVHVSDGSADSPEDFVQVTVVAANQRPVADAGHDVTVVKGQSVTLESKSSDPDGDALSFSWTVVAGPALNGLPGTGQTLVIVTPANTTAPYIDLQLTVSDGVFTSADTVRIWLQSPSLAPVGFTSTPQKDGSVLFISNIKSEDSQYIWTFGDNTTSTTTTPGVTHKYAVSGTYNVTLKIAGASDPVSQPVTTVVPVTKPGTATQATSGSNWMLVTGIALAALAGLLIVGLVIMRRRRAAP